MCECTEEKLSILSQIVQQVSLVFFQDQLVVLKVFPILCQSKVRDPVLRMRHRDFCGGLGNTLGMPIKYLFHFQYDVTLTTGVNINQFIIFLAFSQCLLVRMIFYRLG